MGFRAVGQSVELLYLRFQQGRRTLLFAIESYQSRLRLLAYFEGHV